MSDTPENDSFENEHSVPFLQVIDAAQTATMVPVIEGQSLFAGSGAACGVVLCGDVNSFHGMFSLTQGKLWIQDCNTTSVSDILLNGTPIEGEMVLNHGDTLSIGDNEIVAVLDNAPVGESPTASLLSDTNETSNATLDVAPKPDKPRFNVESDPSPTQASFQQDKLSTELIFEEDKDHPVETPILESLTSPTPDDTFEHTCQESEQTSYETQSDDWDGDEFAELELLRSEIEFLQCELSSRDAQLESIQAAPTPTSASVDDADVERMANRLEELLLELQTSDERVRSVEELLVASEEATHAEQEERRQLESWLGEIENRVSQREDELQAELTQLSSKYKRAQQLQQKAENQLRDVTNAPPQSSQNPGATDEQLQSVQAQLQQMARELESSRGDCVDLQAQLDKALQADKTSQLCELEQKLIRVELDTSRERADIARQRAELERLRDEMQQGQRGQPTSAAESRLVAMRQHLREIHEEEKSNKAEQQQKSLTGRIASLLRRP